MVALTALGATSLVVFAACTGDDTPPAFFPEAGTDVVVIDTGTDVTTPDAAPLENAKVILVHASPDVPAVRVCFGIGTKSDGSDAILSPLPPLPDVKSSPNQPYPGIFPGFGGQMPDLKVDLSPVVVTPYAVFASAVKDVERVDGGTTADGGALASCAKLIGGDAGALVEGTDYLKLPTIPQGTLAKGTTLLLAMTGCLPIATDPNATAAKCGTDYNGGTGNVAAKLFVLDRKLGDQAKIGVRVVHASQPLDGVNAAAGSVGLVANLATVFDGGSGTQTIVAAGDGFKFGEQKPTSSVGVTFPTSAADGTFNVFGALPDGGTLAPSGFALPTIHSLTTGAATGADGYYVKGQNTVFVVVGDPALGLVTDAGINGYALHVLAFPTNPAPIPYP